MDKKAGVLLCAIVMSSPLEAFPRTTGHQGMARERAEQHQTQKKKTIDDYLHEAISSASEDIDKSISLLNEAEKYYPNEPKLYYSLGSLYLAKDDFKSSSEQFSKLKHLIPLEPIPYLSSFLVYYQSKDYIKAKKELDELFQIDPNNVLGRCFEGYLDMVNKEPERAIENFRKGGVFGRITLSKYYTAKGDFEKAQESLKGIEQLEEKSSIGEYKIKIMASEKPVYLKTVSPVIAAYAILTKLELHKTSNRQKAKKRFDVLFPELIEEISVFEYFCKPDGLEVSLQLSLELPEKGKGAVKTTPL